MRLTLLRPTFKTLDGPFPWRDWQRLEWFAPPAAVGVAIAIVWATPGALWMAGPALGALVVWCVWQDLASFTISDAALVAMALIAVALRWSGRTGDTLSTVLAAAVLDVGLCGGIMLAFREIYYRRTGIDGLGLGDVKLAAAGALLVGGIGFSWALFAASLGGLASVAAARLTRPGRSRGDKIAFGALLAPAFYVVWLVEQALPRLGWA